MEPVVVSVEGVGKRYRIGRLPAGYDSLRESVARELAARIRRLRRGADDDDGTTLWALKDVGFEVRRGEILGIVGRNGAGKSTLLKILSRITEPTSGRAQLYGRVGSLLEVGTGFHPELTGRENIYLNGAILGMRKAEIEKKFDEIVSFAETEKFLDTPVKFYSSGMYVRLAFAVAAHLQPEILLVDEVLAVGDVAFQRKCIGRMEKAAGEGKTVIVVSHSSATVKALCAKAILLDGGEVKEVGEVNHVLDTYLASTQGVGQVDAAEREISDAEHMSGVRQMRVKRVRLLDGVANTFTVCWRQPIAVSFEVEVLEPVRGVAPGAGVRTPDGAHVFTVQHDDGGRHGLLSFDPGEYVVNFTIENSLRPGVYKLHLGADQEHIRMKNIFAIDAVTLEVLEYSQGGAVASPSNMGLVNGDSTWEFAGAPVAENHGLHS